MTAQEARKATKGHIQEFNEPLHNEIIDKINKKASEPANNTSITITLPPLGNIQKLVELGYNILEVFWTDKCELHISWEKPQSRHHTKHIMYCGRSIGIPIAIFY